jgi:putative membrane protein
MFRISALAAATVVIAAAPAAFAQDAKPTDAQIAHVAYTADQVDIAAGRQALKMSRNAQVRAFATEMVRDHTAVNQKATALAKKLKLTPEDNPTSQSLKQGGEAKRAKLAKLDGAAFDRAYVKHEVAFHRQVNSALEQTLIPDAQNPELKNLLQTGLKLFQEHQRHAEQLEASLK